MWYYVSKKIQGELMKIAFVCHGNICRSPMAEFVFKNMIVNRGLTGKYYAASLATSDEEIWGGVGSLTGIEPFCLGTINP